MDMLESGEDEFFRQYGRAVYYAQLLERNLATFLCFYEARRQGVLRRPSPPEIDALFEKVDGNTTGDLLDKLREHHCLEPEQEDIFRLANRSRRALVHRFSMEHPDKFDPDTGPACEEVLRLAEPINVALQLSKVLVEKEIERMRQEVRSRRET